MEPWREGDLFAAAPDRPGGLGCAVEIAATIGHALESARVKHGLSRADVAQRMAYHLGDRMSEVTLNAYTSQAQESREITLRRAISFDAAIDGDVLLSLFARKRGERQVITKEDTALLELARLYQQEKAIAARKRALEAVLITRQSR